MAQYISSCCSLAPINLGLGRSILDKDTNNNLFEEKIRDTAMTQQKKKI